MSSLIPKMERILELLIALLAHLVTEIENGDVSAPDPLPEASPPAVPNPTLDASADAVPPPPPAVPAASPSAPPPPAVPAASPSAPPPPAVPLETDVDGVPWDARIHAGNKGKTSKGQWRKRRGVDETVFTAVMAELKGIPPAPPPPAATSAAPPAPPPPAAAPAETGSITTFIELMGAATKAGKSLDAVTASAQKFGVGTAAMLNTPEYLQLIPSVAQDMGLTA